MTTEALPGKGGGGMQFASTRVDELWGRQRKEPQWRLDGNAMVHRRGNKLKLVDGKWVSA
jgi:hypothetical protein